MSLTTWGGAVFAAPILPPILNGATGSYTTVGGTTGGSSSNPTTVTPIIYSAITVSPKETVANPATESQPIGQNATRTFTITNASNIPDAYVVSALTAGSQKILSANFIGSGSPVPITLNSTVSSTIAPGGTIQVQVVIATTGMTVGTSVPVVLTAHTTVTGTQSGIQSDSGEQFIVPASPTSISGPGGPNTQVQKTVNLVTSVQSSAGAIVQFQIAAMNSGSATATNVKVSDVVPAGLTPIAGSETINGAPAGANAGMNGQTVTFSIAQLTAGSALTVAFTASVDASASLGNTYVNVATIAADGIPPQTTTPASVLDGSANIVFDGALGGSD
ncbi:MAG: isopeptide-forming domain-containing fimbrial protein, partial [Vulcanimicrobiaceae bacterium]